MSDLTKNESALSFGGQENTSDRIWVKPTLERLSLKNALTGMGGVVSDFSTKTGTAS